jgi:endonuclease YncB( thermonuclease family)
MQDDAHGTLHHFWVVSASLLSIITAANADELVGTVRVVDGDTLVMGEKHVRLEGIDAPETDQVCLDRSGERWSCGISARDRLAEHIGSHEVTCFDKGNDRYGRALAICSSIGEDLNGWMVREGLALAYVKYSKAYIADEAAARAAQRGMWSGSFISPWDYRHRNKETVILGTVSVPISCQAKLLAPVSSAGAPSYECTIKGNVNRKRERIYHLPGQLNYSHTSMDKGLGERWFCTEAEAEAAGWRKAIR